MKIKNLLIVFIAIASFTTTYAQNTTMAKAYLKKAQDSYYGYKSENYLYKEAFDFIEKCKEQLNGETNPEIIYLEAKIRYKYDSNTIKTKELINQFMNEAFEDDKRIEEMAGLLIEIDEDSDDFCNGHRKEYSFINSEGNIQKEDYNSNCELERVRTYQNNGEKELYNEKQIKNIIYENGEIKEETTYSSDNKYYTTSYYKNGILHESRKYRNDDYVIVEELEIISAQCNKLTKYDYDGDWKETITTCETDKVKQIYTYYEYYNKITESTENANDIIIIDKKSNTVIFNRESGSNNYYISSYSNRMIEEIYTYSPYNPDYDYYWNFSREGYPTNYYETARRRIKKKTKKIFNMNTFQWEKE